MRLGRYREPNHERRSFRVRVVVTDNFSAMFADNAVANTESKTSSLADILGGEEWIEDAIGIGDSGTVIAKRNFDEGRRRARDLDARRPGGFSAPHHKRC